MLLGLGTNSPELLLLKFLQLTYLHNHFFAATLDFTSFFMVALGCTLLIQLGLDFTSFCICIPQSWPMASIGAFLTYIVFLSLPQEEEIMKQMLNTLNIYNFISKHTNYNIYIYIIHIFITELSTWWFLCN